MSLSVCTDSLNIQNGISELTIDIQRTPNGDTNFPMATSKTFIAVGSLQCKLEQAIQVFRNRKGGGTSQGDDRGDSE